MKGEARVINSWRSEPTSCNHLKMHRVAKMSFVEFIFRVVLRVYRVRSDHCIMLSCVFISISLFWIRKAIRKRIILDVPTAREWDHSNNAGGNKSDSRAGEWVITIWLYRHNSYQSWREHPYLRIFMKLLNHCQSGTF